ncbi:hypothetical protein GCM10028796_42840 [Ramlibacter monticola]
MPPGVVPDVPVVGVKGVPVVVVVVVGVLGDTDPVTGVGVPKFGLSPSRHTSGLPKHVPGFPPPPPQAERAVTTATAAARSI